MLSNNASVCSYTRPLAIGVSTVVPTKSDSDVIFIYNCQLKH